MQLLSRLKKQKHKLNINLNDFQAVIFDVDGTLYNLKRMYGIVTLEIVKYYLKHPQEVKDIKIITTFMEEREKHACDIVEDVENAQYEWTAKALKTSTEKVRTVAQKWIFDIPLKHLYDCRYPEILELFAKITNQGIATGIFSDYPAQAKIAKLGLFPDCIVSSTDKNIGRLKPDPKGLLITAEILGVPVKQCLFIGDRDDRDGECARKAGMPYLILGKSKTIVC
ncbi:MAG: HAD family hydrolase [Nostocaceae cyanobacterium]|nr:HAD family hydrolase [Nostocaceae cyanobacterium]